MVVFTKRKLEWKRRYTEYHVLAREVQHHSISIWPDDLAFRICLGNLSSGSTRRAIREKRFNVCIFIKPSFELAVCTFWQNKIIQEVPFEYLYHNFAWKHSYGSPAKNCTRLNANLHRRYILHFFMTRVAGFNYSCPLFLAMNLTDVTEGQASWVLCRAWSWYEEGGELRSWWRG